MWKSLLATAAITIALLSPLAVVAQDGPTSQTSLAEQLVNALNGVFGVHPGMRAKVWLSALNRREAEPLKARLAWISPDSIEDKHTGQPQYLVRVVLKDSREQIEQRTKLHAGMRTEILIVKGTTTVLDSLLDPVLRSIERAYRDH